MSAHEKRLHMAKLFERTQNAMSETVDDVGLETRRAVPFPSTWEGASISEHGPIPTDAHLIESKLVIFRGAPKSFKGTESSGKPLHLSGIPWASYNKPTPSVFAPSASSSVTPVAPEIPFNEEMFRTQYMEWTLQKNAYNPDIAAAMRTNVRKQASLSMVDPSEMFVDPARSSANVKAALTFAEEGAVYPARPKQKLALDNVYPCA